MSHKLLSLLTIILLFFATYILPLTQNISADNLSSSVLQIELKEDFSIQDEEGKEIARLLKGSHIFVHEDQNGNYLMDWFGLQIPIHSDYIFIGECNLSYIADNKEEISSEMMVESEILILDNDSDAPLSIIPKGQTILIHHEDEDYYYTIIGNRLGKIKKIHDTFEKDNSEEPIEQDKTQLNEESVNEEKEETIIESTQKTNETQLVSKDVKIQSSFTKIDKYFQVITDDLKVYDNRSGTLIEIGTLKKGQVYPRVRDYTSWHEIKFGDFYAYVKKEGTKPVNNVSLTNENNSLKEQNEKITFKLHTVVYDNTSGKLVPFATVFKGVKVSVLKQYSSWYAIDIAGRIGYVRKDNVEGHFNPSISYFEVTENLLPVYDNSSGKLVKVGEVYQGQVYERTRDYTNWHQVKMGDKYVYVNKEGTRPATKSMVKNLNSNVNTGYKVLLLNDVTIYDNSSGKLIPFVTVSQNITYPIIKEYTNWVSVDFAGRIGYVKREDTKLLFTSKIKYFKVKENNVPVYDNRSGQLKIVGYLKNGEEYKRIRDYTNWHQIKFGDYYGYVKKSSTDPIISPTYRNPSANNAIIGYVKMKYNTNVYYYIGKEMVTFSYILKNEEYPIVEDRDKWLKINLAGRYGFINKNDVIVRYMAGTDIVNPRQVYTYEQMKSDINELTAAYPDLIDTKIIGKSVDGRNIYALKLGKGQTEIMLNGSHHAREYMTTNLLMEMIDQYAQAYVKNRSIDGYNAKRILDHTSIWFVPMVNPDGVTLVQKGHTSAKNPQQVLKINGGSTDFSAWKANIRGVDLNRQYPADWENIAGNTGKPAPQNYKGSKPLSEPEARAMYDFTNSRNFKTAVAYHSSGEILYWHFHTLPKNADRDRKIANMISSKTGYSLVPPQKNPSGGGFTDWFILKHQKPGFTPEISPYVGPKPVPLQYFDSIWMKNNSIGLMLAQEAYENRNNR